MVQWNLLLVLIGYQAAVIAHELGDGNGRYAECGSGKVNWPVRPGNMGSTTRTKRQSPQPIRISPYYVTANISSAEVLNMLRANDGPVAYTRNYFQRTLSVIPFQQNIRAPQGGAMCGPHVTIPNDHAETGVANADYLYYITAVNDEICRGGFIVAFAGACYVATAMDNNRPYIGFVNYCPTVFTRFGSDFINTLSLHETTHALVFTPFLFRWFPLYDNVLSQDRIDGQDVPIITTPKVVQAARDHYNCPTLAGPPLENEGGELSIGTHWESRTLFPELMNGLIYDTLANTTAISRITLSLFEDSGWYTVNYEVGLSNEELLSGSNEGCNFVTANCNSTSYPYSCTCCDQQIQCTYDYQAAGACRQYTFFDSCPVLIPLTFCTDDSRSANINNLPSGIIADRGPQSICVDSNNPDPSATIVANCVVHRCVQIQGTELIAFSLTFNDQTEWCYPNGTVNNGQLQCPPVRYACAGGEVDMLSPDDPIPPPLCDASCASCMVAQNPAFCQSCVAGRRLNGNGPTSCLLNSNPCTGNTYLASSGECLACPTGCALCNGPQNYDCLACEDALLYRDTTNMVNTACVIRCGLGAAQSVDVFGVRTCVIAGGRGSGAMGAITGVSSTVAMLIFTAAVIMNI